MAGWRRFFHRWKSFRDDTAQIREQDHRDCRTRVKADEFRMWRGEAIIEAIAHRSGIAQQTPPDSSHAFQRVDALFRDEPIMGSVSAVAGATFVLAALFAAAVRSAPTQHTESRRDILRGTLLSGKTISSQGQCNLSIEAGTGKPLDQARPILGADERRCCSDSIP